MSGSARPSVVVLGMMTKMPVAGVVWQTLHYLLGFERLGYETYYVETHGRTPSMLMAREEDDGAVCAAAFIAPVMRRFGFGDRWAYREVYGEDRCFGMSREQLARVLGSAGMVLNLHGGTEPLPDLHATDRLVYLETDPVQLQLELTSGYEYAIRFLEPHCAFFTFAENLGAPGCALPVTDAHTFHPTRQPVVTDLWEDLGPPSHRRFTTIGNWRQHWREVELDGEVYSWSKDREWAKVLGLPARVGPRFELALSSYEDEDRRMLEGRGWRVVRGMDVSRDLVAYQRYIAGSYGELTVAKDQNVRLCTGWFSDRSATYLAAGRPVVTQDTGFGRVLPTGRGLFAFSTEEEAVEAVERIDRDPEGHRRAAQDLAQEFFAHDVVLGGMLRHLGMPPHPPTGTVAVARGPFPLALDLEPVSRRPTRLAPATVETVARTPLPDAHPADTPPTASVVVVSWNGLAFTRLCLETVLAGTDGVPFELIVVDNGSEDGSGDYLVELAERDRRVRVIVNPVNAGFPAACNQGLAVARGERLVLLNSDTMVPPWWLRRLLAVLDDPSVGMVGPVTNRIGGEAQVGTSYRTWGEFLREARGRARRRRGATFEIPTLTMFCLAMRREVHAELGPLDTAYGIGTLEDDDYSMRAHRAGYRLVCAEDVLVHHFGEGSFGKLFPSGEFGRVIERNRERFAATWGQRWRPYGRRQETDYVRLVDRVRETVREVVPEGSTVLVVSRGDDRLLEVDGVRALHFPCTETGDWAGHNPADAAEAIARLEELRSRGAEYIAFPRTAFWWLDFYDELAQHLGRAHEPVARDEDCALFALTGGR